MIFIFLFFLSTFSLNLGSAKNSSLPNYFVHLFQNESSCKTFHRKMSSINMKQNKMAFLREFVSGDRYTFNTTGTMTELSNRRFWGQKPTEKS